MSKPADPRTVYLKNVRLSYPHLFERHKANETAEPKFSATFLIDPTTKEGKANIKKIEAAIEAAEQQAFKKTGLRYKDDRKHFMDGNDCLTRTGEIKPGYEDMMVVKASNKDPFPIRNRDKKLTDPNKSPYYGGCYVEVFVSCYGTTKGGSPGLFFSLDAIRFFKDGERFGREEIGEDAFDDYEDDDEEGDGAFDDDDEDDDLV